MTQYSFSLLWSYTKYYKFTYTASKAFMNKIQQKEKITGIKGAHQQQSVLAALTHSVDSAGPQVSQYFSISVQLLWYQKPLTGLQCWLSVLQSVCVDGNVQLCFPAFYEL